MVIFWQVKEAAKEFVGWDDAQHQQQQQQQQQQQNAVHQHRPPLVVRDGLFDHASVIQIEMRQPLQKDVYVSCVRLLVYVAAH